MRYLTDTHTLVWWDFTPERLSAPVLQLFEEGGADIFISVVNAWEIQIKRQLGKIDVKDSLEALLERQRENGFSVLPVEMRHVIALSKLDSHHRDPFDRLLIAQALADDMVLLTKDDKIGKYGVSVLW